MKTLATATSVLMLHVATSAAADLTSTPWKLTEFPSPGGAGLQLDLVFTSQIPDGPNYRLTGYFNCFWQGAGSCSPQSITASLSAEGRISITVPLPAPDEGAWPWLAFYEGQVTAGGVNVNKGTVWYYGGGVGSWTAVTPPRLTVSRFGHAQTQVAWSTDFGGYMLEHATSVPTASWTPVTNRVAVAGSSFSVTIDANAPQRFFRLRKP